MIDVKEILSAVCSTCREEKIDPIDVDYIAQTGECLGCEKIRCDSFGDDSDWDPYYDENVSDEWLS